MTNSTQPVADPILFRPEMEHEELNENVADADLEAILRGYEKAHTEIPVVLGAACMRNRMALCSARSP